MIKFELQYIYLSLQLQYFRGSFKRMFDSPVVQQQQESRKKIIIGYEHQEWKVVEVDEDLLKNLRRLKKKILNHLGFEQSQGKKIQLSLLNIYPNQPSDIRTPIFNEQNLKLLTQFLKIHQRDIIIQCSKIDKQDLLEKKQMISQEAIENRQLHFDQNGSIIQDDDDMMMNIPFNQKYDNSKGHVRCQFCQKNNQDIKYLKRCGGYYGPFDQNHYIHLLCALWCHKVYLNEDNYLCNVEQQIKRASKKKCVVCKENGAGLVCFGKYESKKGKKKLCTKNFHFKCAYEKDSLMNWVSFKMLCSSCKQQEKNVELIEVTENKVELGVNNQQKQTSAMEEEN